MTQPVRNPRSASAAEAAAHLYLTPKRFHELVKRGTLTRGKGGRGYDLDTIREQYIDHLRRPYLEKPKPKEGELDPVAERARKDHELANKTALQNAVLRGELAPVADFQTVLEDAFLRFRSRILVLPNKLAPRLEDATRATIQQILKAELEGALMEISSTKYEPAPPVAAEPEQPTEPSDEEDEADARN